MLDDEEMKPVMKLIPLRNGLFVRPEPEESKTSSGIILKAPVQSFFRKGEVVTRGYGMNMHSESGYEPMTLEEGDIVMFPRRAGMPFTVDGEELLYMTEDEVTAVEQWIH
jgi:chaperonin GroES